MHPRVLPFLLVGVLAGCSAPEGNLLTYWGPDITAGGETQFKPGERLAVTGLVTRTITDSEPSLDLLEVVFVESPAPATCSMYAAWMQDVAALQEYVRDVFALAPEARPEAWQDYVCQELGGAARDAFGGDGNYRALHLLLNATGGGPASGLFRPASPGGEDDEHLGGDLTTSQRSHYAARLYERSKHAKDILPSDADTSYETLDPDPVSQCASFVDRLAEQAEDGFESEYPDHDALALQTATHRWYHHNDGRDDVALDEGGSLPVGVTFENWRNAATEGGDLAVNVFLSASRTREDFPYENVLLTTKGVLLRVEACSRLDEHMSLVWPEVEQLGAAPLIAGDDDDSAN